MVDYPNLIMWSKWGGRKRSSNNKQLAAVSGIYKMKIWWFRRRGRRGAPSTISPIHSSDLPKSVVERPVQLLFRLRFARWRALVRSLRSGFGYFSEFFLLLFFFEFGKVPVTTVSMFSFCWKNMSFVVPVKETAATRMEYQLPPPPPVPSAAAVTMGAHQVPVGVMQGTLTHVQTAQQDDRWTQYQQLWRQHVYMNGTNFENLQKIRFSRFTTHWNHHKIQLPLTVFINFFRTCFFFLAML